MNSVPFGLPEIIVLLSFSVVLAAASLAIVGTAGAIVLYKKRRDSTRR